MIRMVLSLFVFALTICLLIVLEPFQPPSTTGTDADQPEVEVTRAATENAPVSTPVSLPTAAPRAPGGLLTTDTTTRDLSSSVLADLGLASPDSGTPVAQPQNTAEYLASLQQGAMPRNRPPPPTCPALSPMPCATGNRMMISTRSSIRPPAAVRWPSRGNW